MEFVNVMIATQATNVRSRTYVAILAADLTGNVTQENASVTHAFLVTIVRF